MTSNNTSQQSIHVVAQYVKDLSFENPGQGSLSRHHGVQPEININIQVNTTKSTEDKNLHFVDLIFKAVSKVNDNPLFIFEITYTGVFNIIGFDNKSEEQIINIQCPSILFPFIRRIISEKIVDGGYPPLLIDPIDFQVLYMQKISAQKENAKPINPSDTKKNVIN